MHVVLVCAEACMQCVQVGVDCVVRILSESSMLMKDIQCRMLRCASCAVGAVQAVQLGLCKLCSVTLKRLHGVHAL
jgi:hypothetical protein